MSPENCLKIIRRCLPTLRIRGAKPIAQGWDYLAVEVNEGLIFRFPRRASVREQLKREIRLLALLKGRLSLPVPRFEFIFDGKGTDEPPFVGYRKIEGVGIQKQHLTAAHVPAFAEGLGAFLTELHSLPTESFSSEEVLCAGASQWRTEYVLFFERIKREVHPLLVKAERDGVEARWAAFLDDDDNFTGRPVLTHGDLGAEHILCDPNRGVITGIIDWGDAQIGDPALDFTGFFYDLGRQFTQQVLQRYDGDIGRSFWERIVFYAWLVSFYEILFGLETDDDDHVKSGLEQLRSSLLR